MKKIIASISAILVCATSLNVRAQQVLTLDECKQMAIENNNALKTAQQKIEIANYDKKIAFANYFPKVSATGTYMYSSEDIKLISDESADKLQNLGTGVQNSITDVMTSLMSDPAVISKYLTDPAFQKMVNTLKGADIATPINAIGAQIADAMTLDMQNTTAAIVSVQQPIFMGGKIVASNAMAGYAKQLAESQYDQEYSQVIVDIEQAYWQIVSIAAKKQLSENYAALLKQMSADVDALIAEGFATPSDALTIKVKANEADMLYTKATNGLALAKMLLCKEIGLPLDSEIVLADENSEAIPTPELTEVLTDEQVYAARPEIRSLDLAKKIYDQKVTIARSDALPKVALSANYVITNPNVLNGFQNNFGGFFTAGVMVSVPICHGGENIYKTNKAKAEAALTQYKLDDAKEMISLQVAQLRQQENEAFEKLTMAQSNLANAEENLRVANAGWSEGMVASNVLLQAQTAWLQAHSECIETGVELQMCSVKLAKAEGRIINE